MICSSIFWILGSWFSNYWCPKERRILNTKSLLKISLWSAKSARNNCDGYTLKRNCVRVFISKPHAYLETRKLSLCDHPYSNESFLKVAHEQNETRVTCSMELHLPHRPVKQWKLIGHVWCVVETKNWNKRARSFL